MRQKDVNPLWINYWLLSWSIGEFHCYRDIMLPTQPGQGAEKTRFRPQETSFCRGRFLRVTHGTSIEEKQFSAEVVILSRNGTPSSWWYRTCLMSWPVSYMCHLDPPGMLLAIPHPWCMFRILQLLSGSWRDRCFENHFRMLIREGQNCIDHGIV